MPDRRRKGDKRPKKKGTGIPLNLTPSHDEPFRWLPRHGEPSCIGEWISQRLIVIVAWLPVYTAIVTTLVLLVLVFGTPYLGD